MRKAILLTLPLLILACTTANTKRVGKEYPPRSETWPIAVFCSGTAPAEVARITMTGNPQGKLIGRIKITAPQTDNWSMVIGRARKEARSLGGDEVLITSGDVYLKQVEGRVYRRE
jgi:hypothetical protein